MGESTCKSQDYAETWEGGFIRLDAKGRKVYVIRRMINGRNYKVQHAGDHAPGGHGTAQAFRDRPEAP